MFYYFLYISLSSTMLHKFYKFIATMKKLLLMLCIITASLQSCQKEKGEVSKKEDGKLKTILENYYQERLKLFPLEATSAGDNRYNNLLPNDLSDDYIAKIKAFFTKYKEELAKFDDSTLSENDKLSKAILAWECDAKQEAIALRQDLQG